MELLSNLALMVFFVALVIIAALLIRREMRVKDDERKAEQQLQDRGGWPPSDDIHRPIDEIEADSRDQSEDVRRPQ
jgi:hypothetical protein